MKHSFGLQKARYFGLDKTHTQLALAAVGQTLLKTANKTTLKPPPFAIT